MNNGRKGMVGEMHARICHEGGHKHLKSLIFRNTFTQNIKKSTNIFCSKI